MDVNDNAGYLVNRDVWTFFASKLAPTVGRVRHELLLANVIFPAARNGMPHGTAFADKEKGVRLWLFAMARG